MATNKTLEIQVPKAAKIDPIIEKLDILNEKIDSLNKKIDILIGKDGKEDEEGGQTKKPENFDSSLGKIYRGDIKPTSPKDK